jgi:hypothetical protein
MVSIKAAAGIAMPFDLAPYRTPPAPVSLQLGTEINLESVPLFFLRNHLMFLNHPEKEDVNGKVSMLHHDFWTRSIETEVSFDTKSSLRVLYFIF